MLPLALEVQSLKHWTARGSPPPHPQLEFKSPSWWLDPQYLQQCLAYSKCSIYTGWVESLPPGSLQPCRETGEEPRDPCDGGRNQTEPLFPGLLCHQPQTQNLNQGLSVTTASLVPPSFGTTGTQGSEVKRGEREGSSVLPSMY